MLLFSRGKSNYNLLLLLTICDTIVICNKLNFLLMLINLFQLYFELEKLIYSINCINKVFWTHVSFLFMKFNFLLILGANVGPIDPFFSPRIENFCRRPFSEATNNHSHIHSLPPSFPFVRLLFCCSLLMLRIPYRHSPSTYLCIFFTRKIILIIFVVHPTNK